MFHQPFSGLKGLPQTHPGGFAPKTTSKNLPPNHENVALQAAPWIQLNSIGLASAHIAGQ